MHVEHVGSGPPEVAVVGGIHGDEPAGVRAVEYLRSADLDLTGSVTLVVANEVALDRGVRYVEEDLNRAFPPRSNDPETFEFGDSHEGRLAADLYDLLADKFTLAIHTTKSHPGPFGVVVDPDSRELETCAALPVDSVVDSSGLDDGRLLEALPAVEVETGRLGTDRAAENARRIARAFLAATGATSEAVESRPKPLYRIDRPIPKPNDADYEVVVDNFELVAEGETFATVDGVPQVATTAFVPVLLSAYGYADLFGYAATRVGSVTADGAVDYD